MHVTMYVVLCVHRNVYTVICIHQCLYDSLAYTLYTPHYVQVYVHTNDMSRRRAFFKWIAVIRHEHQSSLQHRCQQLELDNQLHHTKLSELALLQNSKEYAFTATISQHEQQAQEYLADLHLSKVSQQRLSHLLIRMILRKLFLRGLSAAFTRWIFHTQDHRHAAKRRSDVNAIGVKLSDQERQYRFTNVVLMWMKYMHDIRKTRLNQGWRRWLTFSAWKLSNIKSAQRVVSRWLFKPLLMAFNKWKDDMGMWRMKKRNNVKKTKVCVCIFHS